MLREIGDKVVIKQNLKEGMAREYDEVTETMGMWITEEMLQYVGQEAEIVDIDEDGDYVLNIDNGEYLWSDEMFEKGGEV